MKKIIFLICFYTIIFSPAFSIEDNIKSSTKDEVRQVKLEAKQKVQKIKAEARAKKIKAKEDKKQAQIVAENNKKQSEFDLKLSKIKTENDAKKAEISAIAKEKKDKIDKDLNDKILKINNKSDSEILKLKEKYEGKKIEKTPDEKTQTNISDKKEIKREPLKIIQKPVVSYSGINFETKKAEIMDELNLDEKQRINAEKLYTKAKEEIAFLNISIENTQKEIRMLKKASTGDDFESRSAQRRIEELEEKMNIYLQKRDSVHNAAMKKFEGILDDNQKEIWLDIKTKGVRIFPDIEEIK